MDKKKRNKMIINCTGFNNSGGYGTQVFLREYGYYVDTEVQIFDCSDALFQLEDKLFATTSSEDNTEAILRFREMTENSLYFTQILSAKHEIVTKEMKERFFNITNDFIAKLGKMEGSACYYRDYKMIALRGQKIYELISLVLSILPNSEWKENKKLFARQQIYRLIWGHSRLLSGRGRFYLGCTRSEFLLAAKEYINNMLQLIDEENRGIYCHLIRGGSINRVTKDYFDGNVRTLVTWRDPRDQYINLKLRQKVYDVYQFIGYYKRCMTMEDYDTEFCMLVRLEDMIFNHERTANAIVDFLGIEDRRDAKKREYDARESAGMGGLFLRKEYQSGSWEKEIKIIEQELSGYLFDWEKALNDNGWRTYE